MHLIPFLETFRGECSIGGFYWWKHLKCRHCYHMQGLGIPACNVQSTRWNPRSQLPRLCIDFCIMSTLSTCARHLHLPVCAAKLGPRIHFGILPVRSWPVEDRFIASNCQEIPRRDLFGTFPVFQQTWARTSHRRNKLYYSSKVVQQLQAVTSAARKCSA